MAAKPNCLIVCSSASQGKCLGSVIYSGFYSNSFRLQRSDCYTSATVPGCIVLYGHQIDFVKSDENSRKWLNEFRTKPFSFPGKLEDVDASRYGAILIPSSPGALHDLAQNTELAKLLNAFIHEKKLKCELHDPSVFESARSPDFSSLPLIIEDWIKDNGGTYSGEFE
ncbi:Glutamine amidotransferase-like class 1 domain-containing protein 1 [Acropora cervicornis]|uniref:Glutamine amidotransferase-like class 1 domain-containing protein 1 n=1 Tax=Acropora cervicornis TaxID=6130 RepID=A0AAD9QXW5_ACRCE|nr:Glutamine amidotransferase-like class 1 domain-containing protein 1 [Acropora cervicornis]